MSVTAPARPLQLGWNRPLLWIAGGVTAAAVAVGLVVSLHTTDVSPRLPGSISVHGVGSVPVGSGLVGQRTGADALRHAYGSRGLVDPDGRSVVTTGTGFARPLGITNREGFFYGAATDK